MGRLYCILFLTLFLTMPKGEHQPSDAKRDKSINNITLTPTSATTSMTTSMTTSIPHPKSNDDEEFLEITEYNDVYGSGTGSKNFTKLRQSDNFDDKNKEKTDKKQKEI